MTDDPTIPEGSLPAGEASEERLWTCVGHALTCWEHMESELAWLYTIFVDRPGNLGTLADYGDENGTFSKRLRCVLRESMNYFRKRPDQADEGEFSAIFHQATELSIVRHRIAHGITRPVLATRETPRIATSTSWALRGTRYKAFARRGSGPMRTELIGRLGSS